MDAELKRIRTALESIAAILAAILEALAKR